MSGKWQCQARKLVSCSGETAAIPSWDLQSSAATGTDLGALSRAGVDTKSWYHVGTSKCTLMGCLIEAGVYNETDLFYSDNMRRVDAKQFSMPWIFRNEFSLDPGPGRYFSLQTHGISSRADIFLNGQQVASAAEQAGPFVGKTYDITKLVSKQNAIGIQGRPITGTKALILPALSVVNIVLDMIVNEPAIWWPKQWGAQPLYNAKLTVKTAKNVLSDFTETEFGFRTVTSTLNAYNDTTFHVNGHPFQVLGAGLTPDIFLRWSPSQWERSLRYILDLGFNLIRLEGKNEHPALYSLANRLGVMVMVGWECCDKWEAWSYNTDLPLPSVPLWTDEDYTIAHESMLHEAAMLQSHPSVLTYLIGSDYWPDERATSLYLSAFKSVDWQTPIIGSASKRGFSPQTGPSGMKMEGPYDWVPPNYWFDTSDPSSRYGAALGFGSELSAGVGTPELFSLRRFLSPSDLDDLWRTPDKALYHMSRETSKFTTREIYNTALWNRYGKPTSLKDYVLKAQVMDYEATRAQVDAYTALWSEEERPATGMVVYWLAKEVDVLEWEDSTWYYTPVSNYTDYTALGNLELVNVSISAVKRRENEFVITLENQSEVPAFFLRIGLGDGRGNDVLPLIWDDNYITLWPKEKLSMIGSAVGFRNLERLFARAVGMNVEERTVEVTGR
ncbi:hypothetical protein N0V88_003840 [Collariella sp. IMI 366227]|nr:hypothetical protein N0V88_003840 [Collariella sp. IMI 366227]